MVKVKEGVDINGQLELFTKVNSSLDDVGDDIYNDHAKLDPHDDPFSGHYRSKVLCEIDDKYHPKSSK